MASRQWIWSDTRRKKCVSISVSISPHNRWHILEAIKALQPRGEEGRLHFFTTVRLLLQGCRATENLFLFLRLFSSLTQIEEFGIDIQAFWNSTFYHVLNTARGAILCHVWMDRCLCLNFKYGHSSSLLSMFAALSLLRGTGRMAHNFWIFNL